MPARTLTQSRSPANSRALAILAVITMATAGAVQAETITEANEIPHVGRKGHENLEFYRHAGNNKAFAIAPGGAWAWSTEAVTEDEAAQQALNDCQSHTRQKCVLYALNNKIVFDRGKWVSLWGPYANAEHARQAQVGTRIGQRFHTLTWKKADGKRITLDELKGKIVFLHFWGSWCPPCLKEFPSLKILDSQLHAGFGDEVAMILLQVQEPYSRSRQWAQENGFSDLPLFDSGATEGDGSGLTLVDGSIIAERELARVFPSTYVLDRHGLVLFSHYGPVADWTEYLPFIDDAIGKTRSTDPAP